MSGTPYTDADLRTEAARYLGDDMDGLEILVAMADRTPWSTLGTDDFNTAHGQVVRMAEAAADVSEWAVNLGADGLEPIGNSFDMKAGGSVIVRVHFAFRPDVPEAARDSFVAGAGQAVAERMS